ncbi:MAG: hypothetical protein K9I84_16165 [Leadbetterella sp.]|nr:hypothetical protein [Leadbetterella sp.]
MESEFKNFEDQWKGALNDASVPPPDFVWENIEKELDQKKKKRVAFLWWKNPALMSGFAAALVLGLTLLFVNNNKSSEKTTQVVGNHSINTEKDNLASSIETKIKKEKQLIIETQNKGSQGLKNNNLATLNTSGYESQRLVGRNLNLLAKSKKSNFIGEPNESIALINPAGSDFLNLASQNHEENNNNTLNENQKAEISKINQKGFRNFANRFQPFRSHISVDFEDAVAEVKTPKDKLWFGLSSGVAPFNPNFENKGFTGEALSSARNDPTFVAKNADFSMSPSSPSSQGNISSLLPNSLPETSFKNGTALNFGFSFGKKLKKRIGIESGLRYMQASAFLSTNVYAIDETTGEVNSYFQSNYLDKQANNTQTVLSVNATNKQLYNYFNVPLLLNYSLPIVKNLGVEALGGISGDLFVFGKSDSENEKSSNLTASNSAFNLLNVSGMGGLRLNYNINKSWEANMGTTYQRALISGVSSDQNLSFKPRTFGINYGVRFKMK